MIPDEQSDRDRELPESGCSKKQMADSLDRFNEMADQADDKYKAKEEIQIQKRNRSKGNSQH